MDSQSRLHHCTLCVFFILHFFIFNIECIYVVDAYFLGNATSVPSRLLANRLTWSVTSQAQLYPTPPSTGSATHPCTLYLFINLFFYVYIKCIYVVHVYCLGNTTQGTTSQPQLNHTLSSTGSVTHSYILVLFIILFFYVYIECIML